MMKNVDVETNEWDLTILNSQKGAHFQSPIIKEFFLRFFRPYFEALIRSLDCTESDQQCFYALSVLLTMTMNPCNDLPVWSASSSLICHFLAVDSVILESVCLTVKSAVSEFFNSLLQMMYIWIFFSKDKSFYNTILVGQLCKILRQSTLTGKINREISSYMWMIFRFQYSFGHLKFSDQSIENPRL